MTIEKKKHKPPLIVKTGIVWLGNYTRSNSTTKRRGRRSREFIHKCLFFYGVHEIAAQGFFGYFLLRKKNGEALLIAFEKQTTEKSDALAASDTRERQTAFICTATSLIRS